MSGVIWIYKRIMTKEKVGEINMFGSIIYYDKNKIDEYKSIITGKKSVEVTEYQVTNDKGVNVDFKIFGADAKANKSYTAKIKESLLYDCSEFEKMLEGRDDYCDFSISDDYDIESVPRGYIVRIDATISIPENFDTMKIIDQFKPLLLSDMDTEEDENGEYLKRIFNEAKAKKIPLLIDFDEYLLCSKIHEDNLLISYEDVEELEGIEVTILARCSSSHFIKKTKAFYDPLKDFLALNRTMRKSFEDRGKELSEIFADKDYKIIDILAIYQ